jgi:plasmid stabilization system protein ParE
LGAIAEYIAVSSPVYGEQVVDRVVRRLEQAQRFPESGRAVPEYDVPEIRELLEFPYRLIYRVGPDAIEVLAILHGRRDLRSPSQGE